MVQTSHVDFEWPQSVKCRNEDGHFRCYRIYRCLFYSTMYRWRLTDCNVLFNSLCRIPKSARQSIPEDQCSSNVLCESVRPHLTHTQREECISLSVTHHVHPRRALHFTSSITYHVEPLHITYIHVDGVVHTKRSGSSFRSICRSFLQIVIAIPYRHLSYIALFL